MTVPKNTFCGGQKTHSATLGEHAVTQCFISQHSTAQHSTAQHSTAQHSTAQRSTAPQVWLPHLQMLARCSYYNGCWALSFDNALVQWMSLAAAQDHVLDKDSLSVCNLKAGPDLRRCKGVCNGNCCTASIDDAKVDDNSLHCHWHVDCYCHACMHKESCKCCCLRYCPCFALAFLKEQALLAPLPSVQYPG